MTETDVYKVSILGKDSIHCGFHLAPYIARTVLDTLPASTYVLVTDTNIGRLHLDTFQKSFNEELTRLGKRSRFLTHTIPPGETSKSREGKAAIEDFFLLNKCTRDTVVLALGGGVIGDLVGFVAATLCVLFCSSSPTFFCACGLTCIDRSMRAACAAFVSSRSRRLSSLWSTRAWAERPRSTRRTARTSSARSGSPSTYSSTPRSSRPSPRANSRTAWQRSSRCVVFFYLTFTFTFVLMRKKKDRRHLE